jgi:hypothetical protein
MLADEKQLRWMGIDMRSRAVRRVAVVGTYLLSFCLSTWLLFWKGYGVISPAWLLFGLFVAIEYFSVFQEGLLLKSFGFDEREREQLSHARQRTLLLLKVLLISGVVSSVMQNKPWRAMDVATILLTILVIVSTGPKARLLWTEPDPREADGEMEMVGA